MLGALLVLVVGVALLLTWLWTSEPRTIYFPTRDMAHTPADAGLAYEDVGLAASDGVRLHAWFVPARADSATGPDPPGAGVTLLFLHGNASNISDRVEKAASIAGLGANVLLLDYRGYGRSEGRPAERGTYRDARAAWDHLTGARGFDPRAIVLYGESLGTGVATWLAREVRVGGVVLEEAFTSVPDVAQALYPFLPVHPLVRNRYDSIGRIAKIGAPLLLLHSRDDEYFPLRHAERLLEAARPPKRLVVLRGGHNEVFLVSHEAWLEALGTFLREVGSATAGRETR
jgi:pimeloyl-ACP methyl ester carboxylesterase